MSRIEADLVRGRDMIAAALERYPNVPAAGPDVLRALKHLVRWHDQLTPADIDMAKAAIARAEAQ